MHILIFSLWIHLRMCVEAGEGVGMLRQTLTLPQFRKPPHRVYGESPLLGAPAGPRDHPPLGPRPLRTAQAPSRGPQHTLLGGCLHRTVRTLSCEMPSYF